MNFNSIKKIIKELPFLFGMLLRRIKFVVLGFKNNPHKKGLIKDSIKLTYLKIIKNPKKYIPVLKIIGFLAASVLYLLILFNACGELSKTGYKDVSDDKLTIMPRNAGFLSEHSKVTVGLNWTNGVLELKDGMAYAKLKADISPKFLSTFPVSWETSDKNIAEVSDNGDVTAIRPGKVTVTASINNGKYSATANLRVLQPVEGLLMTTSNVTLYMGGTGKYLKVQAFPEDATNTKLKWESKNTDVVTVDSSGRVEPVGLGMTEVVAKTEDGKFSAKSFVTVVNYSVKVDTVNIENEDSEIMVGENLNLVASVKPYNAKNKTLFWSSDNDDVVTVSQTGRVKALREGEAIVSAESVNGIKSTVKITVSKSDKDDAFNLSGWEYSEIIGIGSTNYTSYSITLPMLVNIQMGLNPPPQIWRRGGTDNATESEVAQYLNPQNYCDDIYKYQFLDLSYSNGVTADTLNNYLDGKGVLEGKGEIFKRAAELYNVSEVYLVAHACLETGNGTSKLSTGVEVNGETVYNMFGIAAYDDSAVYSGSQKAYKEGWTSVEEAIMGGAEWISRFYINSSSGHQNTLYKMLWNPDNPGVHLYATDIGWAVKQAEQIARIFESFPEATLSFNIPVYSGQTAPEILTE